MMVWFAGVVLVQLVELRVGLVAEGFTPHGAEVKMEAVQQEMNLDPGSPGLWTYRRGRTRDEGGAVHCAARLVLGGKQSILEKYQLVQKTFNLKRSINM